MTKGDVYVGHDGWRVVITTVKDSEVTFFAGYDTITESRDLFLSRYVKENSREQNKKETP